MLRVIIFLFLFSFSTYALTFQENLKNNIDKIENKTNRNILYRYYKRNNFKPFWIKNNQTKDIAFSLIDLIDDNMLLRPYKKDLFNFRNLFHYLRTDDLLNFEIHLTLYYDKYTYYLNQGIINTKKFDEELLKLQETNQINAFWQRYTLRKNRRTLLYKIIKTEDITLLEKSYKITYPKTNELLEYINKYEEIIKNGDFIKINHSLKIFDKKEEVKKLRLRLHQENPKIDLLSCKTKECLNFFDYKLEEEVKNFQLAHGLKADGIVGKGTRRFLNMSAIDKISLIRLNIERTKWLPKTLGKEFFIVNIPEYNLKLYENNKIKLTMPIVVGEKKYPTAIFSNKISAVVLNPYWRIPQSIVKNEVLPKAKEKPNYLKEHGIKIHENWEEESQSFDITQVDWSYYLNENKEIDLPLKFIQEPSKHNPLGKIKFLFPNKYAIYLHDSPAKKFFSYTKRAYSHGCIRLSQPKLLLETISKLSKNIDFDKSLEILKDNNKTKIELDKTIPIHIVYQTTWVNEKKQIQFREDIYGFDKIQEELIKEKKWLYY